MSGETRETLLGIQLNFHKISVAPYNNFFICKMGISERIHQKKYALLFYPKGNLDNCYTHIKLTYLNHNLHFSIVCLLTRIWFFFFFCDTCSVLGFWKRRLNILYIYTSCDAKRSDIVFCLTYLMMVDRFKQFYCFKNAY